MEKLGKRALPCLLQGEVRWPHSSHPHTHTHTFVFSNKSVCCNQGLSSVPPITQSQPPDSHRRVEFPYNASLLVLKTSVYAHHSRQL